MGASSTAPQPWPTPDGRRRRPDERSGRNISGPLLRQPLLVVGLDGSTAAWRAAAYALGQARRQGAGLAFVYVNTPLPWWAAGFAPQLIPYLRDAETQAEADITRELAVVLREENVPWELLYRRGCPVTQLARAADALCADAVVVGASRRRPRRVTPSVAGRLLRSRHWLVTVVP